MFCILSLMVHLQTFLITLHIPIESWKSLEEKCILEEMQITIIYLNGTVFEQAFFYSVLFLNTYFLIVLNIFLKRSGFAMVSYL